MVLGLNLKPADGPTGVEARSKKPICRLMNLALFAAAAVKRKRIIMLVHRGMELSSMLVGIPKVAPTEIIYFDKEEDLLRQLSLSLATFVYETSSESSTLLGSSHQRSIELYEGIASQSMRESNRTFDALLRRAKEAARHEQFDDALSLSKDALETARKLDDRQVIIRAHREIACVLYYASRNREAEDELNIALQVACETGDNALRDDILHDLAIICEIQNWDRRN